MGDQRKAAAKRGPQTRALAAPRGRAVFDITDVAAKPVRRRAAARHLLAEVEALRTALAEAEARVKELEARAETDPLTNVLNRRGFERELARAIAYVNRYGTRAGLVCLDLDGFKPVNDTHGHAAGDAVLCAVAAALLRHVRASDVVARLGGDEFAVLLWNLGDEEARAKALALEVVIDQAAVRVGARVIQVGASAGVTMIAPLDGKTEALARADDALYVRKAERRSWRAQAG